MHTDGSTSTQPPRIQLAGSCDCTWFPPLLEFVLCFLFHNYWYFQYCFHYWHPDYYSVKILITRKWWKWNFLKSSKRINKLDSKTNTWLPCNEMFVLPFLCKHIINKRRLQWNAICNYWAKPHYYNTPSIPLPQSTNSFKQILMSSHFIFLSVVANIIF